MTLWTCTKSQKDANHKNLNCPSYAHISTKRPSFYKNELAWRISHTGFQWITGSLFSFQSKSVRSLKELGPVLQESGYLLHWFFLLQTLLCQGLRKGCREKLLLYIQKFWPFQNSCLLACKLWSHKDNLLWFALDLVVFVDFWVLHTSCGLDGVLVMKHASFV